MAASHCSSYPHAGPRSRFQQSRKRWESNTRTLYHQTDSDSAKKIVGSQKFRRGDPNGLAGSGIYFAVSPGDTDHKARKAGPILKATVLLGKVKTISPSGDNSVNFHSLRKEGYDSVKIPRAGGDEYVVYSCEQVRNIRYHSGKPQPVSPHHHHLGNGAVLVSSTPTALPVAPPTTQLVLLPNGMLAAVQGVPAAGGPQLVALPSHHGPPLGMMGFW